MKHFGPGFSLHILFSMNKNDEILRETNDNDWTKLNFNEKQLKRFSFTVFVVEKVIQIWIVGIRIIELIGLFDGYSGYSQSKRYILTNFSRFCFVDLVGRCVESMQKMQTLQIKDEVLLFTLLEERDLYSHANNPEQVKI